MLKNLLQETATEDHHTAVQEGQLSREHSLKSKSPSPHPSPVTRMWWLLVEAWRFLLVFCVWIKRGVKSTFFYMVCHLSCFLAFSFVLLCFLHGLHLYLMRTYACLMVIEIICYEQCSMCCYTSNIVFVNLYIIHWHSMQPLRQSVSMQPRQAQLICECIFYYDHKFISMFRIEVLWLNLIRSCWGMRIKHKLLNEGGLSNSLVNFFFIFLWKRWKHMI